MTVFYFENEADRMSESRFILDMTAEAWEKWTEERGFPRFRAEQIASWCNKGVTDPAEMTNLPKTIIEELKKSFDTNAFVLEKESISEIDGTR